LRRPNEQRVAWLISWGSDAHDLSLVSYSFAVSGYDYVDGVKTNAWVGLTAGPAPYVNIPNETDFCDGMGDCIRRLIDIGDDVWIAVIIYGESSIKRN
jgi:hypothetical protein